MARKRSKAKKRAALGQKDDVEGYKKIPHTFVVAKIDVGKTLKRLTKDIRHMMEPYTARNLKMSKSNCLKDFITTSSVLNVTHVLIVSIGEKGPVLRVVRCPGGPTLTFRIDNFTLSRDVLASLEKQTYSEHMFQTHPLLIMNNVDNNKPQLKLVGTNFQNMLPSVQVNSLRLSNIRRALLLCYNGDSDCFDLRHYAITPTPVGVNKPVEKLLSSNRIPDLSEYSDVSQFILDNVKTEPEKSSDLPVTRLAQSIHGKGNVRSTQCKVKLSELGPRMKLILLKVEEGVSSGGVLYHLYLSKTEDEIRELDKRQRVKETTKMKRKLEQQKNVEEKLKAKKKKQVSWQKNQDVQSDSDEDNDQYFKQEMGMTEEEALRR